VATVTPIIFIWRYKMDRFRLPTSITIGEKEIPFNADYRNAIYIFKILVDPDLLDFEKIELAMENFYETDDYLTDIEFAAMEMMYFLRGGAEEEHRHKSDKKPLYDWEKDYDIIVAPINRVMGKDVRGLDFLHWWTFLSAFMEIGECTFNTYVGIRDKLNRGKKLEKWEETIFKEHKEKIKLEKKVDSTTQALMDEIMGRR
jgi:hypothetical protein